MGHTLEQVFTAVVQREGAFTFVALPFPPRDVWGARPRYPVAGAIDHFPVKGTLGALGKEYFLRLSAAWLRESGLEPGAEVAVKLSLDESRLRV